MATKTITLEIDAYEKLKRARRSPRESFSSVVRRGVWSAEPVTASALLEHVRIVMADAATAITEDVLDDLDHAQERARTSEGHW